MLQLFSDWLKTFLSTWYWPFHLQMFKFSQILKDAELCNMVKRFNRKTKMSFPKAFLGSRKSKTRKVIVFLNYVVTYLVVIQSNHIQIKNCIYIPSWAPPKIHYFFKWQNLPGFEPYLRSMRHEYFLGLVPTCWISQPNHLCKLKKNLARILPDLTLQKWHWELVKKE